MEVPEVVSTLLEILPSDTNHCDGPDEYMFQPFLRFYAAVVLPAPGSPNKSFNPS